MFNPYHSDGGIALGLFVGVLFLTHGLLLIGLPPLYLLVEYVFLERGGASIAWAEVVRYAADEGRRLIAIEVRGWPRNATPIVMQTEQYGAVLRVLRARCPQRMAVAVPKMSRRGVPR